MPFVDEGLVLEPDGRPGGAVRRVVVDDWYQVPASEIAAAAARAADSLSLATRPPPRRL
ncbi:hypothetical protein ACWD4J_11560 [Streptomyces sp. NPDC002577]